MKKIELKKNILFIHHAAGWGGAPINMINIINELDKSKFDVHVLLLKDSVVKKKLEESGISYSIANSIFFRKFYKYLSHSEAGYIKRYQIFKLFKVLVSWFLCKYLFAPAVLRNFSFDILHLNSSVLSDWIKPGSKFGKVVFHVQEPLKKDKQGFRYNLIRNQAKNYAGRIIAISKDNSDRINIPEKTDIVYNFTSIPPKIENNFNSKQVLYVGGASVIKGIELLIMAIPMISKDIIIEMAGHYPRFTKLPLIKKMVYQLFFPKAYYLRNLVSSLNKYENVKFIGSYHSFDEIIDNNYILISPFKKPHFSRPIVEAYAHGKPVIASDVAGMNELVLDGITGVIVNKSNPAELSSAVNKLILDQELMRYLGDNGRKKAIEIYSPEVNIKIVENIYINLLS